MLRLDKLLKPWNESAELCDHINLYGFWNGNTFLTKSGDLGMVLKVTGFGSREEILYTASRERRRAGCRKEQSRAG